MTMDEEKQSFLGGDRIDDEEPILHRPVRRWSLFHRIVYSPYTVHITMMLAYTLLFFVFIRMSICPSSKELQVIYSPARSALQYERKSFNEVPDSSSFSGDPRPELDAAWHNLMQNTGIRVSAEDLQQVNGTSIELENGGYLIGLSVYHELHCLKKIRQELHADHYYAHATEAETHARRTHLDHCLEMLRQASMCRGDISMYLFEWEEGNPKPATQAGNEHDCISWEGLENWAKERMVDIKTEKMLRY